MLLTCSLSSIFRHFLLLFDRFFNKMEWICVDFLLCLISWGQCIRKIDGVPCWVSEAPFLLDEMIPQLCCPTLSAEDVYGLTHSRIFYEIVLKTCLWQYLSAQEGISLGNEAKFWQWGSDGCFSHPFNCFRHDV